MCGCDAAEMCRRSFRQWLGGATGSVMFNRPIKLTLRRLAVLMAMFFHHHPTTLDAA